MKSIKSKIFFVVLSGIISASVIVGGIGIYWSTKAVKHDAAQVLDLMVQVQSADLDSMFSNVEQSTKVLANYASEHYSESETLNNGKNLPNYLNEIKNISYYIANCTNSAMSVYVRFSPEVFGNVSSILWHKKDKVFSFEELSDFPIYNSELEDNWYYHARAKQRGIWTNPYYNDDINEYLISYLVPVYKNGKFIAVIGMDIDFDDIVSVVNSITVYDSGFAFLTDEDFVIRYHRRIPYGTRLFSQTQDYTLIKYDGLSTDFYEFTSTVDDYRQNNRLKKVRYRMVFKNLQNGMRLAVSVPVGEIDRTRTRLVYGLVFTAILISILLSLFSIWMSGKITRPLKKLADSTKRIVVGEYDFEFDNLPDDEIGELMSRFDFMAKSLKRQFEYINSLAYLDAMTGAKNKRAFIDETDELNMQIKNSKTSGSKLEFGVIVFDVNYLKTVNDNFGHKAGDQLIKTAYNLITKNFSLSKIFRTGGDEFVVTITGRDYENRTELLAKFRTEMDVPLPENNGAFEKVSIASGLAVYDSEKDTCFQNVVERADGEMYKTKISMKGGREFVR